MDRIQTRDQNGQPCEVLVDRYNLAVIRLQSRVEQCARGEPIPTLILMLCYFKFTFQAHQRRFPTTSESDYQVHLGSTAADQFHRAHRLTRR
mgnify:CR=1 FL=1